MKLHAALAGTRIPMQVDIGFGDAVYLQQPRIPSGTPRNAAASPESLANASSLANIGRSTLICGY